MRNCLEKSVDSPDLEVVGCGLWAEGLFIVLLSAGALRRHLSNQQIRPPSPTDGRFGRLRAAWFLRVI